MSAAALASARKCVRCGHTIVARGDGPPRYCAVCGHRLTPLHVEVDYALGGAPRTAGSAVAALVLGLFAFIPMCGLPLGLLAIGFGISAKDRIKRSDGRLDGHGLAVAGIVLGVIGSVISTLFCLSLV